MSCCIKPLTYGKKLHFNVIYNHGMSPLSATEDNKKSLQYAQTTVSMLTTAGFDKSYYHDRDSRPGRNIFSELFRVIKEAEYTLLILTPGFLANCWAKYAGMSAFKQLLDKGKDHRLKALAFRLTDKDIPEELCQHEVLHFLDDIEADELKWRKLIQEMTRGDTDDTPTHTPITETGDNRVHTDARVLVTHPSGEPSLQSNSLYMDAGTDSHRGGMPNSGRENSSADQTFNLVRRTESLQIDGDESVSGTADGMVPRQSTTSGTSNGSSVQRAVSAEPGGNNEGQGPRQTNISATGDHERTKHERELMTKQLHGQKTVTLDLKLSPSPRPTTVLSMSLEASPTVSAPVVAKMSPLSAIGRSTMDCNRTDNDKMTDNKVNADTRNEVYGEMPNTEGSAAVQRNMSLTNDSDLTLDDGGTGNSAVVTAIKTDNNNAYFNENREQIEDNLQNAQSVVPMTVNESTVTYNNDISSVIFQALPLVSLQEETLPKQLSDSGYNTEIASPEDVQEARKVENSNAQADDPISSRWYSENSRDQSSAYGSGSGDSSGPSRGSMDMQKLKEFSEDIKMFDKNAIDLQTEQNEISALSDGANVGEPYNGQTEAKIDFKSSEAQQLLLMEDSREDYDSITELKRVVNSSSDQQPQDTSESRNSDETERMKAYSDSSERPAPDGEDAGVSSGAADGVAGSTTDKQSEEQNRIMDTHSPYYNWTLFSFHCVSRAISRTDSLL